MQYYVVWPNGQRFGPVDVDTLRKWHFENRIDAQSTLQDATTGQQMPAAAILGYGPSTYSPPPPNQPAPYQGYYRPNSPYPFGPAAKTKGTGETNAAYILGVLGIVGAVCPIGLCGFGPFANLIGLILAIVGKSKNQSGAVGAIMLNLIAMVVGAIFFVLGIVSLWAD